MAKYRKKPVVIEAHQLGNPDTDARAVDALHDWATAHGFEKWESTADGVSIETLEGVMLARPGDWIIKGMLGEFYPCKPQVFLATYEPAE